MVWIKDQVHFSNGNPVLPVLFVKRLSFRTTKCPWSNYSMIQKPGGWGGGVEIIERSYNWAVTKLQKWSTQKLHNNYETVPSLFWEELLTLLEDIYSNLFKGDLRAAPNKHTLLEVVMTTKVILTCVIWSLQRWSCASSHGNSASQGQIICIFILMKDV